MDLINLSDSWSPRQYAAGQILIYAGDEVSVVFYIKKGYVKVYSITDEGEEHILLILKTGDIFPLLKDPEQSKHLSLYFYQAITIVELSVIEQKELLNKLKKDLKNSWELLRYTSEFSSTLTSRLAQLESKGAEEKLVNLFAYLISICGKPTKLNAYLLDLKLTHQDIASLIGLTRETVSTELKNLQNQGKVVSRKGFLLIDKQYQQDSRE